MVLSSQLLSRLRSAVWLPVVMGLATIIVGVTNIISTLTPALAERLHILHAVFGHSIPLLAHAIALPLGLGLVLVGISLAKRRERAWLLTTVTLILVGFLNIFKGLDVEEAIISWGLAAILYWARDSFYVRHDHLKWDEAMAQIVLVVAAMSVTILVAILATAHWSTPQIPVSSLPHEIWALLTLNNGPVTFHGPFKWIPTSVTLLELSTLFICIYLLLRPLRIPSLLPGDPMRHIAHRIVQEHGHDSLSFFQLRNDKHYFFDQQQCAFVSYKVESGFLLLSSDPVGPPGSIAALLKELREFASQHGLKIAVVGASENFAAYAQTMGFKSLYIGDEAIIDTADFSLEGRAIRKVRQSVTRLTKLGYSIELVPFTTATPELLISLEKISQEWLVGKAEKGFSMSMGSLSAETFNDGVLVVGRDSKGQPRGFLHFVPAYGSANTPIGTVAMMSLNFMRRADDTPNGFTEFLVVNAIKGFRESGVCLVNPHFCTVSVE